MATKKQPGVWGIDIGQCALKALRLEMVNGEVTATAFDYIEHPKILSQPDADPDQLTRQALEQFLSRNEIRGDQIAISVPGQTGLARFVKLPPVEPSKIPDIVRFEAKQQVPFPLDEVVWDWQALGTSDQTEGFIETEIGLFAMKRDMVNRYLQAFQDVNVEVHYVQMAPLSLCNFIAFDLLGKGAIGGPGNAAGDEGEEGKHTCIVGLDIGADSTSLVVTDGEKIIWQRPIPIGGNHFTRALTKDMKLTFAKAEHLKRNAIKAEDSRKIFQSMKPVFTDFVGEVKRSLGFFTNTHRDAHVKKVIGLGNAFRLAGLQKFVSQNLEMNVEKLGSFERLRGDEVLKSPAYSDNVLSFGVAYGLALQALALTRLRTNLLPQEIQLERTIRAKKPWAVAAAACLLIGTAIFVGVLSSNFTASVAASDEAKKSKSGILMEVEQNSTQFNSEVDQFKQAVNAAAAILRGGEERTNWAFINRYIVESIPQPNGRNLPKDAVDKYWTVEASQAYRDKREQDEKGPEKKDAKEAKINELVQIHLHSVYARYCDTNTAKDYYNRIKSGAVQPSLKDPNNPMASEVVAEWKDPPNKPCWLFEVRGYTFHKASERFVIETFVQNLRNGDPNPSRGKGVWSSLSDPAPNWRKLDISHVAVIYSSPNAWWSPDPKHRRLKYIDRGGLHIDNLGELGGGTGAAAAAGGEGAAAGGGGSRRGAWGGLGSQMGLGTGTGTGTRTGTEATGETGSIPVEPGAKAIPCCEFVITFFWFEPLPSEPAQMTGEAQPAVPTEATGSEGGEAPTEGGQSVPLMGGEDLGIQRGFKDD